VSFFPQKITNNPLYTYTGLLSMTDPKHKIYLDANKYVYAYQFRFLKNIIKTDHTFSSADLRDYMDKFVVYNIISDIEESDNESASLVWFEDDSMIAYQFPQEGKIVSVLSSVGYAFPDLEDMDEDDWI